jgi:hypothetical protein
MAKKLRIRPERKVGDLFMMFRKRTLSAGVMPWIELYARTNVLVRQAGSPRAQSRLVRYVTGDM